MLLHMRTCFSACILLNLNFMALPINNYHICANACLKHSKLLMSARQSFVALFSCSESCCVRTLHMESTNRDRESCEV